MVSFSKLNLQESIMPNFPLCPIGRNDFKIFSAEHRTSKAGNEYIRIGTDLIEKDQRYAYVYDNVMMKASTKRGSDFVFKKFLAFLAVLDIPYKSNIKLSDITEDMLYGKTFSAEVEHKPNQHGEIGAEFNPFSFRRVLSTRSPEKQVVPLDDDIPF